MAAQWQIFVPYSFLMILIVFNASNTMENRLSSTILMKVVKFWEVYYIAGISSEDYVLIQ